MSAPANPTHLKTVTYRGLRPGKKLIVTAAVHGNELHGHKAVLGLISDLDSGKVTLDRGTLTLVPAANPLALQNQTREGERNLNRNMGTKAITNDFEDRVCNVLCPLLAEHDVLLDLHSFHSPGDPFILMGPPNNHGDLQPFGRHAEELHLAVHLGVQRIIRGWLDVYNMGVQRRKLQLQQDRQLANTVNRLSSATTDSNYGVGTTEYMRSRGGYALTLECGQHTDPSGPSVARHAIEQTLALLDMSASFKLMEHDANMDTDREILTLVDVIDKTYTGDNFANEWKSFDKIAQGQLIGTRGDSAKTPLLALTDGHIVFPHAGAPVGTEWFYWARQVV